MKKNFFLFILLAIISVSNAQEKFSPNGIIALITDYGYKDFYVGALKGSILKINPNAKIIDITHEVKSFDVREGMFTALLSAQEYPSGTIFLTIVDPGVGTERRPIAIQTKNDMIFIGPDNGVFTLIMDKLGVKQVRNLTNDSYFRKNGISKSFHGRDIFGPVAAHISKGINLKEFGNEISNYITIPVKNALIKDNKIFCEVIFIDKYGNVQVNVGSYLLKTLGINLSDIVKIKVGNRAVDCPYMRTYGDVPKNNFLIFESSTDFLEIAMNEGSAGKYFNIKLGDQVEIIKIK